MENNDQKDLLVFGYSCKLFRDDEKALLIDKGKHLIPWMNDGTLMIDRYDARLHIYNLADFEATGETQVLTEKEQLEEDALDKERYYDLTRDIEEETYQEEEIKRLKAALAADGAYHEANFNYDEGNQPKSQNLELPKEPEEEDVPFTPPQELACPSNMVLPQTMKQYAIIEKTAEFISQQGGQMEFIIKMKQGHNPQFNFLGFEDPLNPFYKWLCEEIKSGRYRPAPQIVEQSEEDSDDDSDNDHYLHPSLFAAKSQTSPMKLPTLAFKGSGDDTYAKLVKNLQSLVTTSDSRNNAENKTEKQVDDSPSGGTSEGSNVPPPPGLEPVQLPPFSLLSRELEKIVPPPPDIQPIIDKMVVYAAKNGDDFETIVKGKEDKRFDFLYPWNQYHQYYIFKKKLYQEQLKQAIEASSSPLPGSPSNTAPGSGTEPAPADTTALSTTLPPASSTSSTPTASLSPSVRAASPTTSTSAKDSPITKSPSSGLSSPPSKNDEKKSHSSPATSTTKSTKASKLPAPVCFSLKPKEGEISAEKPKVALMLGCEPESGSEECEQSFGQAASIPASAPPKEEKPKQTSEEMEAKIITDKLKDKIAAAARERLQSKKLQQERKKKLALFLDQIKNKSSSESVHVNGDISMQKSSVDVAKEDIFKEKVPENAEEQQQQQLPPPEVEKVETHSHKESTPKELSKEHQPPAKKPKLSSRNDIKKTTRASSHSSSSSSSSSSSESSEDRSKKKKKKSKKHHHEKKHHRSKKKKRHHSRSKDKTSKHSQRSPSHSPPRKSSRPRSNHRSKTPPAAYALIRLSRSRSPSTHRFRDYYERRRRHHR